MLLLTRGLGVETTFVGLDPESIALCGLVNTTNTTGH